MYMHAHCTEIKCALITTCKIPNVHVHVHNYIIIYMYLYLLICVGGINLTSSCRSDSLYDSRVERGESCLNIFNLFC